MKKTNLIPYCFCFFTCFSLTVNAGTPPTVGFSIIRNLKNPSPEDRDHYLIVTSNKDIERHNNTLFVRWKKDQLHDLTDTLESLSIISDKNENIPQSTENQSEAMLGISTFLNVTTPVTFGLDPTQVSSNSQRPLFGYEYVSDVRIPLFWVHVTYSSLPSADGKKTAVDVAAHIQFHAIRVSSEKRTIRYSAQLDLYDVVAQKLKSEGLEFPPNSFIQMSTRTVLW